MKKYVPVGNFERQTSHCPTYVAWKILDEARNYFWADVPEELAEELAARAETVFARNAYWRKKFQGRRGREYLEMFMRHWFSSQLFKRKSPLFRQLPESFKIGKPLPDISLPRQLQRSSRNETRRKRATKRPPKHFVHGCKLLSP